VLSGLASIFKSVPIPPPVLLPAGASLVDDPSAIPAGFVHGVEILNDDSTPMEFVVKVLEEHFGMNEPDAVRTMLTIHGKRGILMPTATKEQGAATAAAIIRDTLLEKHQLRCRAVSLSEEVPGSAEPLKSSLERTRER
jgi:ATP-dependent Clp protease adaptor protein ClpS